MNDFTNSPGAEDTSLTLIVRETIDASAEWLFAAWTLPEHLKQWWGPANVTCIDAQIDLRVGGQYRIANQFPDGAVVWIEGEFEVVMPPHRLVYTWRVGGASAARERVTVRFDPRDRLTDIIVMHERIRDGATRDKHQGGWRGCLGGLKRYSKDVMSAREPDTG